MIAKNYSNDDNIDLVNELLIFYLNRQEKIFFFNINKNIKRTVIVVGMLV
jgi:hypothetical protein